MAGIFSPTGTYSNLSRLELEQLRKADFFAGGKALTVGDSALLPEGIIGKGDLNAEPYLTGPNVLLDDVYSLTPVTTPGSYLGTLTQVYGTASDSVTWYGPTVKATGLSGTTMAVVVGTTDISNPALYGPGGTLGGFTLTLDVNGAGPLTLLLNTATNAVDEPTFLAAVQALWVAGPLSAQQGGAAGNQLVLTVPGVLSTIVVGAGTANALLGLTPGTYGGTTNTFQDTLASFVVAGVLAGDILLVKDITNTPLVPKNMQAVATVTVVGATQLTLAAINAPSNAPTTQLGLDGQRYAYMVVRPGVSQLFAVPGSGPTGKEQTFLAVIPTSTLHTNLSPSLNAINADRVKSLVPSQYTHDTAIDRADGVYAAPAPRVALDKLGYRIVLYPSAGAGGPDFTHPITTLNPVIDPAIPAADQRFTVDSKAGTIRFSCAPQPGSDINPNSFVNATTGRLDLYAVFWAVDQSLTAGSARGLYASRNTTVRAAPASRVHWDGIGWSGGAFSSVTNTGGAFGSDDLLRLYDANTVAQAAVNGGPYLPLSSTTTWEGDQFERILDHGWGDIVTTIAATSNGLALPQGSIDVVNTDAFPHRSTLVVDTDAGVQQYVQYTSKSPTSFLGCTGGTGVMVTGGSVAMAASPLLKNVNARFYCTVGDGFTSFGDFNGTGALHAALTFIQNSGITAATIFLKKGFHTPGPTLDVGAVTPLHLTLIGYGGGNGVTGSVIQPPDIGSTITIRVHNTATLYIKGVQVGSTFAAGHYALQVTDTGRCWGEDCVFTSVDAVSLSSGSGTSASFKRCTITGTGAEAGVTIEAGNATNCELVVIDDSTFVMASTQPPIRFRALVGAGAVGTIEGLRCTRTRFSLSTTTNTGGGTFGNLTDNTGLVDLVPSGEDSRPLTHAIITGTTDITNPGLYTGLGLLNGTQIALDVNLAGITTLNLVGAGNAASQAALFAAIHVQWPALTASQGGYDGKRLVLTNSVLGTASTTQVQVDTANVPLGITPAIYYGTGSALGATVQDCSFDQCVINTPNAPFAGDVNVLLHLVPRGNGATGDVNGSGPFMQVQHFKLKSCRLTSSLGDPSAVPGVFQSIPFSAVNGAAHFEMDDCVFTMIPSVLFTQAAIPDDTAFDYTGTGVPPSIERFGYVAVSCDKVTAKKIVCQGFPQIASIGDLSIRTRDIDVDDIKLQQWHDGGLGSTPSHRLIFEGYLGATASGSIQNIQMNGQTASAGAWATSNGGLMCLLDWHATADRPLFVTRGRITNFLTPAGVGAWPGFRMKGTTGFSSVYIDGYYVSDAQYGLYLGQGTELVNDLRVTRCTTAGIGSGGFGHGLWVYINSIDQDGIRLEKNNVNGSYAEGIVVDADVAGAGVWNGCLWLTANSALNNDLLGSNVQFLVNARAIVNVISTAMDNMTTGAATYMRLLKNSAGAWTSPDATLAQNLRGWQTYDGVTSYVDGHAMLFNAALLKTT